MPQKLSPVRKLLFIAIIGGFFLLFIELLLQGYYFFNAGDFLFKRAVLSIFEPDPIRCYRLQSNLEYRHWTNEFRYTIQTNDQGLRTGPDRPRYEYAKDDDVYRVLLLGPSFAFGWGSENDDAFGPLIAERLRVPGKRVELINIGTPSQGNVPQLCWLEKEGYKYAPDLLLMTTYGVRVPPAAVACPEDLQCPVIHEGALYSTTPTLKLRMRAFVKNFALVFYGFYAWNALTASDDQPPAEAGKELHSEAEKWDVDDDKRIALYRGFLDFVSDRFGDGTDVAFIHIPMSYVVHPQDASRWVDVKNPNPTRLRTEIASQVAALRENGVEIVDTTPKLVEIGADERLYYWLDIHLTEGGNRVVAEAALPMVQGLVDRRFAR